MSHTEKDIEQIMNRNKRVEADKAWETSWTRRLLIAGITYIAACAFLTVTGGEHTRAYIPALIPPMAYLFSTLTLGPVKRLWIARRSALQKNA